MILSFVKHQMLEPFVDTNLILSEKHLTGINGIMRRARQNNEDNHPVPSYTLPTHYTLPGVVQYLQHEWNKFDSEKAQWEMEKNELKKKIASLQEDLVLERTAKNNLEFKISALQTSVKEEKIKLHKLKFGEESMPEDLEPTPNNENEREFLFPIEQVDHVLKKKLANYDYELSREELNKLIKIVFDKMTTLNVFYFRHQDYAQAAKSILVSYPHLAKFDSISERIIREKLRARFSAYRSRESKGGGGNAQILEAREKFTPPAKKRVKGSEDSSGDETPKKNKRKQQTRTRNRNNSGDSTSPTSTNAENSNAHGKVPSDGDTTIVTPPPIHNTRSSRSSITVNKLPIVSATALIPIVASTETAHTVVAPATVVPVAAEQTTTTLLIPTLTTTITTINTAATNPEDIITLDHGEKNDSATAIVDLTEYQAQPTIRISDSILKIINDENENKKLMSEIADDISD